MTRSRSAVSPAIRIKVWNIIFSESLDRPDKPGCGAYQCVQHPFLTWAMLWQDLTLCWTTVDTDRYVFWYRGQDNNYLSQLYDGNPPPLPVVPVRSRPDVATIPRWNEPIVLPTTQPNLYLSLVVHDKDKCQSDSHDLEQHVSLGCATLPEFTRNPDWRYCPKPRHIKPEDKKAIEFMYSTKSKSGSASPTKEMESRMNNPDGYMVWANSVLENWQLYSRVPTQDELRRSVIDLTPEAKCAVTGKKYGFGGLLAGPGIEACHLVPQSLWPAYPPHPTNGPRTDNEKLLQTMDPGNCILMGSDVHDIHDERLLAIQPKTHRVRIFAPIEWLAEYNGADASLHDVVNEECLDWHYKNTVIENMTARHNMIYGEDVMIWKTLLPADPFLNGPAFTPPIDPSKTPSGRESPGKRKRTDDGNSGGPSQDSRSRTYHLTPPHTTGASSFVDVETEYQELRGKKRRRHSTLPQSDIASSPTLFADRCVRDLLRVVNQKLAPTERAQRAQDDLYKWIHSD